MINLALQTWNCYVSPQKYEIRDTLISVLPDECMSSRL